MDFYEVKILDSLSRKVIYDGVIFIKLFEKFNIEKSRTTIVSACSAYLNWGMELLTNFRRLNFIMT